MQVKCQWLCFGGSSAVGVLTEAIAASDFNYNGIDYYYLKNIQGDILKIYDNSGILCAEYSYDAWGKCTIKSNVSNIATINPLRYRGYYYDEETGLYYLNARYYDPEMGRFISPDSIAYLFPETINGLNVYAYCLNNPVMCSDPYGTTAWWEWLLLGLGLVVIIAAAVVATVATGGAALIAGGIAIGGAISGLFNIVGQGLTNGWSNINIGQVGTSMLFGGTLGGFGSVMGGGISIGGSLALAGGGTVGSGNTILQGALFGLIGYLFAKWIPGSWPGDDPTVPPGDGFEWRGNGPIGSDKGAWFNPFTRDSLHPDLNHPAGIPPHWDWVNILKVIVRIFRP